MQQPILYRIHTTLFEPAMRRPAEASLERPRKMTWRKIALGRDVGKADVIGKTCVQDFLRSALLPRRQAAAPS
jgi:hypothetical protein